MELSFRLIYSKENQYQFRKTNTSDGSKLQSMLHPTEEEYEKAKSMMIKQAKLRKHWFIKYQPAMIMHRKFMKRLQDSGYNDIFIPNMIRLSPSYKEYY